MDVNEKCQQCIQLQKQNRLPRNRVINRKQELDKEMATRIALQSDMKNILAPYKSNRFYTSVHCMSRYCIYHYTFLSLYMYLYDVFICLKSRTWRGSY